MRAAEVKEASLRRLAVLIPIIGLVVGLGVTFAGPAHAQAPQVQLCNTGNDNNTCMNKQGGGNNDGTHVIEYNVNDPNNTFEFTLETSWCSGGKVEIYGGGGCPFAVGSGLNSRFDGAPIVTEFNYDWPDSCVANGNSGGGYTYTVLQNCGATGDIYILGTCFAWPNCNWPENNVINFYFTNQSGTSGIIKCEAWNNNGKPNQLIQNDDCDTDAYSGFTEEYS